MDPESRYIIRKICLDFIILICFALLLLAFDLWLPTHIRGYIRDDPSLSLPYRADSISVTLVLVVGFVLNTVAIVSTEYTRGYGTVTAKQRLAGWSVPLWLWDVYQLLGVFVFGALCQQLVTSVGKVTIGRLRPHFFEVCDPEPTAGTPATQLYIQDYACRGTDARLLRDVRLSFPSAHSAFASYAAVYFMMYVQVRVRCGSRLVRHGLQLLAVLACWYTALSRVADNKHHASDVACGLLIGSLIAVLAFVFATHIGRAPARIAWNGDRTHAADFAPSQPPPITSL